jgi:cytochrome P450
VTPNSVSINTATALREIYGSRKAPLRKGVFYQAVAAAEKGLTTFTERDENAHAQRRRLLSHAFSERAIQDSEPYVSANVNKWLEILGAGPLSASGWTSDKNVADWVNYLTFDVLTDLAYGRSFELLTKNDMRFATELIPTATSGVYAVRHSDPRRAH